MLAKHYKIIRDGEISSPFNISVVEGDEILVSHLLNAQLTIAAHGLLQFMRDDEASLPSGFLKIPRPAGEKKKPDSMAELQKNKSMLYSTKKVVKK